MLVSDSYQWLLRRMRNYNTPAKVRDNIATKIVSSDLSRAQIQVGDFKILNLIRYGSNAEETKEISGRVHLHSSSVPGDDISMGNGKNAVLDSKDA